MKEALRNFCSWLISHVPAGLLTDRRFFDRYQVKGFHALPVHFYSPVPDTRTLSNAVFERRSELVGIDQRIEAQRAILSTEAFAAHLAEYRRFDKAHAEKHGERLHLGPIDGAFLHHMVRSLQPKRIIEVGQGSSTRIISEALSANGGLPEDGYFKSIDPFPHNFVTEQEYSGVEVIESGVQSVSLDLFEELGAGDILFIDSTHVVKIDSDVVYEINEILPRLAEGVHVHVHDIYFPFEYEREWVEDRHIFWNEQYMLQAFLAFNDAFEITWSAGIARAEFPEEVAAQIPEFDPHQQVAGSIWFRRKTSKPDE